MSFTHKTLAADFSLASGSFSGGGNSFTAQGLRMAARAVTPGGDDTGALDLSIWGMTLNEMQQLTVLPFTLTAVGQNTVVLRSGENGSADNVVFEGTIISAFADGTAQPNVCFRVQAVGAHVERIKPVKAISHAGTSDVADVMGQIAKSMGRTLENSGVSVKLSNLYLPGSAIQQASALARHAGIQWTVDGKTLAIYPPGQPRQGASTTISPSTGLVGYPAFTASGLILTTLYQGSLKFGSKITVQSQFQPACGDWFIVRVEYQLDCQIPNGRWFAVIEAGKIGSSDTAGG